MADTTGTITGTIGDIALPSTTASPRATTTALVAANLNSATTQTGVRGNIVGLAASVTTTAAGNNSFTIDLNGDGPQVVTVANGLTGSALATAIQNAVRALVPNDPFKAAAYSGFTASVNASNIFTFASGMTGTTNNSTTGTGTVVVTANGGKVVLLPLVEGGSTSATVKRIQGN